MARTGRPEKPFPWDAVEALASLEVSLEFIANYLLQKEGLLPEEINGRRIKSKIKFIERRISKRFKELDWTFVDYRKFCKEGWDIKNLQNMRKAADAGNAKMQKYLREESVKAIDKNNQQNASVASSENARQIVINIPDNGFSAKEGGQ